ncbi:HAMP domain-containing sensor histidine kinase [Pirellulales bacterium]|nr:HAMP domain-containing sensor histidine kinase [Pirellulales bacterium]
MAEPPRAQPSPALRGRPSQREGGSDEATSPEFDAALEKAKLDAMKELAYGASHEINNPLANISARAQTLLRDEHDPDRRRALQAIDAQALRAHEMISDLMLFARPPKLQREPVDVVEVVRQAVDVRREECQSRAIALELREGQIVGPVEADAGQLAVAVDALLRNAIEAIGSGGTIDALVDEDADGQRVRIRIADDGPGIADEVREHLFEPFYSGREAGRGLGFGLSKCWRIVTMHGGCIDVESPNEGGATITIQIPRA